MTWHAIAAVATAFTLGDASTADAHRRTSPGGNLLVNGGAESGDLTGWTDPGGTGFGVNDDAKIVHDGTYCFHGGANGKPGPWVNEIVQAVDVSPWAPGIDMGHVVATFEGYARSNSGAGATDHAQVTVEFLDITDGVLETFDSGKVAPVNQWNLIEDERTVPAGTRTVRVTLRGFRDDGTSTDAFHDAVSLLLDVQAPTVRTSWTRIKADRRP